MNPLSAAFGVGVKARNLLYERGVFAAQVLKWPVISVGNLSVGGSGKTPFTILLGELLQERKLPFDILSRGYKRQTSGVRLVEANGDAREFGDEPLLLAASLHVPVIVGADRAAAGRFAEKTFADLRPAHGDTWFHLLDDGFQHRRLTRSFDIVLVSEDDLGDSLLPVGRLREPLSALQRADAIVVPESMPADKLESFRKPIWRTRRRLEFQREKLPARPLVICGIAKPERFAHDLRAAGVEPVTIVQFPDHHAYSGADVEYLLRKRDEHRSDGFVTTEKDAVNLRPHLHRLQPITSIPLKMELQDADSVIDGMLETLKQRPRPRH